MGGVVTHTYTRNLVNAALSIRVTLNTKPATQVLITESVRNSTKGSRVGVSDARMVREIHAGRVSEEIQVAALPTDESPETN